MLRSIVEPADGWPRVSQLTGMSCQLCLIFMSPQGTTGAAKLMRGTAVKRKITKSKKYCMSTGSEQECADLKARVLEGQWNTENMTGMESFYGGVHGENRGWSDPRVSLKYWEATRGSWQNAEAETSRTSAGCDLGNETRDRSRAQGTVFESPECSRVFLCKPADNQLIVLDFVSVLRHSIPN